MNTFLVYFCLILQLSACERFQSQIDVPIYPAYPIDSISLVSKDIVHLTAIDLYGTHFFLLNSPGKELYRTNSSFDVVNRYSSNGRGPGEFIEPYQLVVSKNHLYLIDFDQQKVLQYSHSLSPQDEYVAKSPLFSIIEVGEERLWLGSFDMQSENILYLDFVSKTLNPSNELVKTRYPMEGLVFHSKNSSGVILRYRQYNNRLDLFPKEGAPLTFFNHTQPTRPERDTRIQEVHVFKSKTHNNAFMTENRACVLSGDHTPQNQPVQCFDFDGKLVARYTLKQDPSMISVYSDSTLYTYSPKTNHIYVYNLGF